LSELTKNVLRFASVFEAATGVALLLVPSLVCRPLFSEDLTGAGMLIGRIAGIALIGLAVACWPGRLVAGMFIYNAGRRLAFRLCRAGRRPDRPLALAGVAARGLS
jgi:hypothetical protein